MRAAQALATLQGTGFVTPDQVKRLAPRVLSHRVVVKPRSRVQGVTGEQVVTVGQNKLFRGVRVVIDDAVRF